MVFYSFENTLTDLFSLDSQSNLMSCSENLVQLTEKSTANILLTGELWKLLLKIKDKMKMSALTTSVQHSIGGSW